MGKQVRELHDKPETNEVLANLSRRSEGARAVSELGEKVIAPGDAPAEPRLSDNRMTLLSGDHGNLRLRQAGTRVGASPGARLGTVRSSAVNGSLIGAIVTGAVTVESGALQTFTDCDFKSAIAVDATSTLNLKGCIIRALVTVTAGGVVNATGCNFVDAGAINNAGVMADANVTGGTRKSGVAHVNCTIITETV